MGVTNATVLLFSTLLLSGCIARGVPADDAPVVGKDAGDGSLTIPQLRDPSSPTHPAAGAYVVVRDAVVTDVKRVGNSHGFFAQDPVATSYAGIYVFVGPEIPTVSIGDVVHVMGAYSTFNGLEEIDVRAGLVEAVGVRVRPAPLDVTVSEIEPNGPRPLELQSMLVRVRDVLSATSTQGVDFTIGEPYTGARITVTSYMANDVGPSPFPVLASESFASITGHAYADGVAELAPMSAADVVRE